MYSYVFCFFFQTDSWNLGSIQGRGGGGRGGKQAVKDFIRKVNLHLSPSRGLFFSGAGGGDGEEGGEEGVTVCQKYAVISDMYFRSVDMHTRLPLR